MGKNKRKNFQKRNGLKNKEAQPQESHLPTIIDSTNNIQKLEDQQPKVLHQNEFKSIIVNDFVLRFNFEDSDFSHVELPSGYENDIKVLKSDISKLITTCKD